MSNLTRAMMMGAAGASGDKVYVDDVFKTYLYDGNSGTNAINNGIDLSGEGGLVWCKRRDAGGYNHHLYDTERGVTEYLSSNSSSANTTTGTDFSSFNSNGFTLGTPDSIGSGLNATGADYASWTFRKAPGFFDIVTYTGSGSGTKTISHNLGSVPGMIICKGLNGGSDWSVYHRSLNGGSSPEDYYVSLNHTFATQSNANWGNTAPTSTEFVVGANANGSLNYVAYIFAHDDAQFGTGGDESIIKCGSFTSAASGNNQIDVNLGFEAQWVLIKPNASANWALVDTMRGTLPGPSDHELRPNTTDAEGNSNRIGVTSTGFSYVPGYQNTDFYYMAIRRPNKPPEAATEVFDDVAYTGTGAANTVSFSPTFADLIWIKNRVWLVGHHFLDRLRGNSEYLLSETSGSEATLAAADSVALDRQGSFFISGSSGGQTNNGNAGYNSFISWVFKRAPGFMDVVAYSGTGSISTHNHNLTVIPELMIVKCRNSAENWRVYAAPSGATKALQLNSSSAASTASIFWNDTAPTSSVFTVANYDGVNGSGKTYINYLFATLPGISKVGSYTGTGNAVNVDCGFTNGARFILIKRTDSTGDWYVWDTARGILSGNDPYLLPNSTAAEVTNTDYIDPLNAGFTVTSSAPAALNASGGTYIFLAIA